MTESQNSVGFGFGDMRPCDMIIFDGEDDWIDNAIMKLTNSTVTHAALYMQDNPSVLSDAGLSGLQMHEITPRPGRRVHVVRHDFYQQLDLTPVVKAANVYLSDDLSYPKANLVLLALILVYKNHSHAGLAQVVIMDILRAASAVIIDLLDKEFRGGKHPMVCSEYVFQCYVDAGKVDSRLSLKLHDADMEGQLASSPGGSLLDLLSAERAPTNINELMRTKLTNDLDGALSRVMERPEATTLKSLNTLNEDLEQAIWQFISLHHRMKTGEVKEKDVLLTAAKKHQAEFVTPNDLLNHVTNAQELGAFKLTRIDTPYSNGRTPVVR